MWQLDNGEVRSVLLATPLPGRVDSPRESLSHLAIIEGLIPSAGLFYITVIVGDLRLTEKVLAYYKEVDNT